MKKEFTFLSLSMEKISIIYGLFLILWGIWVSLISNSNSITSLIPSLIGTLILFLSILAIKIKNKKRLLMHLVVTLGLLTFLGGLDFLRGLINDYSIFINFWADTSKLMMLITGFCFTLLCIKSFIFARKNKENLIP